MKQQPGVRCGNTCTIGPQSKICAPRASISSHVNQGGAAGKNSRLVERARAFRGDNDTRSASIIMLVRLSLVAALSLATALRPTTRREALLKVASVPAVALVPAAAVASTRDETDADSDMKGLLSGFTQELKDKDAAKAQKKLDEERSIQEKVKAEFEKQQNAPKRPGPGSAAVPATAKSKSKLEYKKKYTGDELPGS